MATSDFTTNDLTRSAVTNRQDGQNMKIQIATPGVVFHRQDIDCPAHVVPAEPDWIVPSVQDGPIHIDIET